MASVRGADGEDDGGRGSLRHAWCVKAVDVKGKQAQRRKEMLLKQKERRRNFRENVRRLARREAEEAEEEQAEEMAEANAAAQDEAKKAARKEAAEKRREKKRKQAEARQKEWEEQLTVPEALQEVPADLTEAWMGVGVPRGERCLVVAAHSRTAARGMDGRLLEWFSSSLPNGSHRSHGGGKRAAVTLLDCVYSAEMETFVVLDVICWKGTLYYECDAAFRRYWMESRLAELPQLAATSSRNHYRFLTALTFACDPASLQQVAASVVKPPAAAGLPYAVETLLLYTKEGHYHMGPTPLVLHVPAAHASNLAAGAG